MLGPWREGLNCFLGDGQKLPKSSGSDIHTFIINEVPDILGREKRGGNSTLQWDSVTSEGGEQCDRDVALFIFVVCR